MLSGQDFKHASGRKFLILPHYFHHPPVLYRASTYPCTGLVLRTLVQQVLQYIAGGRGPVYPVLPRGRGPVSPVLPLSYLGPRGGPQDGLTGTGLDDLALDQDLPGPLRSGYQNLAPLGGVDQPGPGPVDHCLDHLTGLTDDLLLYHLALGINNVLYQLSLAGHQLSL